MNAYRDFWDVPVDDVPHKTGAAPVMDLSDIRDVLANLDLDLGSKVVYDVGCGTGRLAQVCGEYVGFDVAPGMVEFADREGLDARLIEGPDDLSGHADIVCCLSVFTHISREDRQRYLAAFRSIAPELLVDILPGDEGGYPGVWFADRQAFEEDLAAAGFPLVEAYSRDSLDGAGHRYYRARLRPSIDECIAWFDVESSSVAAIAHSGTTCLVRFVGGHVYAYTGVDAATFAELRASESIGSFVAHRLRVSYRAERVA